MKKKQVVTPGGVKNAKDVKKVARDHIVDFAMGNEGLIVPKNLKTFSRPFADEMTAKGLVVTPGGFRPKSFTHKVSRDSVLESANRNIVLKNTKTGKLKEFPVQEVAKRNMLALGSGWIAYAFWNNGTGEAVTSFKTSWTVPSNPVDQSNQTIFIFNGIQNYGANFGILQPVLQWGTSAAGGGQYWSIASWYVTSDGHAYYTSLIKVNAHDRLTGVMTLTNKTGNLFSYNCEFENYPQSVLTVNNIAELIWCNQAMEAYSVNACSNYPATNVTAMGNIAINTGGNTPLLNWTPVNNVQDCGQHCVVVSNSASNGEVDIYYR